MRVLFNVLFLRVILTVSAAGLAIMLLDYRTMNRIVDFLVLGIVPGTAMTIDFSQSVLLLAAMPAALLMPAQARRTARYIRLHPVSFKALVVTLRRALSIARIA
jgi:hypothetical protein